MGPIDQEQVEIALQQFVGRPVYLHLETTNGAYAAERADDVQPLSAGAYIRNARILISRAGLRGSGPYRAGLEMELGWIYAEGLTDWELDEKGRLLLAGHDHEGRLAVALELSPGPFPV